MAFSYYAIAATSAHKHTNATGDGGSLDSTTLMNNGALLGLVLALG